tara:strand:+ start:765 stop:1379 length:615 start_codon:yes stop_codon:yes gene_type:complete
MYEKHIIVCKIHNTSLRDIETDAIDVYDTKTLSKLVITLYKKVDDLEKKLKNNVPDKNINIINWLNENERPDFSFKEWIKTINIDEATIKNIIKRDYINGLTDLLDEYINNSGIPLKAFDRKVNELYIYENDMWSIMNNEIFTNFINTLSRNVLNVGINTITTDIDLSREMATNVKKITGGNFKNDKIISVIKKDIYTKIKINI